MENFNLILILLVCSVIFLIICRKLYLPPVIGYLSVGFIIGPGGLGWFKSLEDLHFLGELGIVFLMFTLGLEFSINQLLNSKKALIGIGGTQVLLCGAAITLIAYLANLHFTQAIIIGSALALSSTAVVLKQLQEQKEQQTPHGKLSIKILLFQDIAAVLLLIIIPALGSKQGLSITNFLITLTKGAGVFLVMGLVGSKLIKPLFHEIAKAHSTELFMLATLLVALSAAATTYYFELSMALGAFLAGLMLGETEFKHQIEIDIRPFREVLLGLFFIIVGSFLDLKLLPSIWLQVFGVLITVILIKAVVIVLIVKLFSNLSLETAIKTGIILAQGGEFGFVALTDAINHNLIYPEQKAIIFAAVVISIMLAPLLIRFSSKITKIFIKNEEITPNFNALQALKTHVNNLNEHVIICGFGRVGQILARFLEQEKISWLAMDLDPTLLEKSSTAGEQVFAGDASNPEVLLAAGISKAKMVVLSFDNEPVNLQIVKNLREMRLDLPIFVRTKDDSSLQAFEAAGATEVVPESLEGSIMLASHLLFALGVPTSRIINKVKKTHSNRYEMLRHLYKGKEETNVLEEDNDDRRSLQTIIIHEGSAAINNPIEDYFHEKLGEEETEDQQENEQSYNFKYIIRNGKRYKNPLPNTILLEQDVLVVLATVEEKAIIEERLSKENKD